MGRSACTLGEDSAAAAALDGLLAAGDGRTASFERLQLLLYGLGVVCGSVFRLVPTLQYGRWGGGTKTIKKNGHFITSISMDDNGLIIDNSFQMKREYLIPTQKSKANLMVVSIFGENGNSTN